MLSQAGEPPEIPTTANRRADSSACRRFSLCHIRYANLSLMRASSPTSRILVAVEIAACALAAFNLPRAAAQTEPVFRTTGEVVLVPASVLDKHSRPVTGLTREA